jgi:glycine/D-amino acid oxidase-like deaminating enzyme/nitrite reductase/ring-hydroxylating ferredoxin subunit
MDAALPEREPLEQDLDVDVVVIGAGMAGLSTAYELTESGRSVAVLDRGAFAGGMTARTTAHLASELDDYYYELIKLRGEDVARQYYESQKAAVDRIEDIARREALKCDFARVDALLVAVGDDGEEIIQSEFPAAQSLGLAVSFESPPSSFGSAALRFGDQGRFHPLKYLSGLSDVLARKGARLHGATPVESVEDDGDTVLVRTSRAQVRARHAVVATNSPINDRVAIHTKQAPYRTYAFAAPIPRGAIPDLLIWDTLDPYHYVRVQPSHGHDIVIVGGEDHKSGTADDGCERIAALESWARERMPDMGEITHAWSGQVYEPIDYVPHIGRNPGDERIFVITGDSGEGITSAVAGAMIVSQQILDGESPWADAYEPSRKVLGAVAEFASENADMVTNLTQRLTGGDVDDAEAIEPCCGALLRERGKKIAAYRDDNGALHAVSAICTHMGCVVQFNSFERCWDCPCHGSQFGIDGEVLAGPAKEPLKRADAD